eukprot:3260799-Prymnesium_polylepis.2
MHGHRIECDRVMGPAISMELEVYGAVISPTMTGRFECWGLGRAHDVGLGGRWSVEVKAQKRESSKSAYRPVTAGHARPRAT